MEQKAQNTKPTFWQKILFQIKRVPWYGWVSGFLLLLTESGLYYLGNAIAKNWSMAWGIIPKLPAIDDKIPFFPYFFILIYGYAFAFWFFGPIVISVISKEHFVDFFIGMIAMQIFSFIIFVFAPSNLDRLQEGLITETGQIGQKVLNLKPTLSKFIMQFMIRNDGGRYSPNCIPSLHCSLSIMYYLGICRRKEISLGSRIYALVISVMIGISALLTKQHYIIDMFSGWIFAIGFFFLFVIVIKPGHKIVAKYPNFLVIKKKTKTDLTKDKPKDGEKPATIVSKPKEDK